MTLIRQHVVFAGHVQGVSFRYTCHQIAKRHDVRGFVRNLPDGRVELVAEGAADHVQNLLSEVQSAMADNIHDQEISQTDPGGDFDGFTIRH